MKSVNYTVDRKRIYLGEVGRIYDYNEYLVDDNRCSYIDGYCYYRYMLFVLSDDGYANDLLYESTNYPVLGIADRKVFLENPQAKAVVKWACLDEALKANNYPEQLTYSDIMKIVLDFCYSDYYTRTQNTDGAFTTSDTLYRSSYPAFYNEANINLANFTAASLRKDMKKRFKNKECKFIKEANDDSLSQELKELLYEINKINNNNLFGPFKPCYTEEGLLKALRRI